MNQKSEKNLSNTKIFNSLKSDVPETSKKLFEISDGSETTSGNSGPHICRPESLAIQSKYKTGTPLTDLEPIWCTETPSPQTSMSLVVATNSKNKNEKKISRMHKRKLKAKKMYKNAKADIQHLQVES